MKKALMITMLAGAVCACSGEKPRKAIDPVNFNPEVALEEDFYEHFTGGWQKLHPLKPEFSRYGAFDVVRENNEIRINELFGELAAQDHEYGSVAQKIADLYKLGMDSVRLNSESVNPLDADYLKEVNADNLATIVATMHTVSGSPFFVPFVDADLVNPEANALYIYQDGLGMGNKDYYLDPANERILEAYKLYITKLFTLATGNETYARTAMENVLAIEMDIARGSFSQVELRDIQRNYNPTSVAKLAKDYPAFDWATYFKQMGISVENVVVGQPSVLAAMNNILKTANLEQLRDYLAFHEMNAAAPYLSDEWTNARFEFFGRAMSGQEQPKPRWKRALSAPNNVLGEAVGELYVAKYFPESHKAKVLEMVQNLQTALGQHIESLEWMGEQTKQAAIEKLSNFIVKIGYPDTWKDYSTLEINPETNYWENMKRAQAWYTADAIAKLGKPVDKMQWLMSPQTVNAYYNPVTNEICFPAAILQPPFFDPEADDAVNYGAIGVVIGHEMTHGFDDQGRQFDKDGKLRDWWAAEDAAKFNELAQVLVEQFNKIEVMPGLMANGQLSLGENIADQGGLKVSYTAFMNTLEGTEPAPIDGFTAAQRFYIGYTNVWAQNIRDEEIAKLTKMDPHSLGKWRVNATLRNIQEFYDAFDIKEGDAMWMAPEERVNIW
ncbi:MAG: M13 family metallopeptidase [Rikenellaceae bacterium]|nr:M13 family metallopeptidase [Rikenellaceae bacterium]